MSFASEPVIEQAEGEADAAGDGRHAVVRAVRDVSAERQTELTGKVRAPGNFKYAPEFSAGT